MLQIETWKRILICITVAVSLLYALPNAFYNRVEAHNDAVHEAALKQFPSDALSPDLAQRIAAWSSWMPSSLVNLGLDLRGGAHLLAEVQLRDVYADRLEGYWPQIREALVNERASIGPVRRLEESPAGEMHIRIANPDQIDKAVQIVQGQASALASLGGIGATDIIATGNADIVVITLSEAQKQLIEQQTLDQSLEIVRRRIDAAGTREPTIQKQGSSRILIQVPGIGSAEELKELIGTTARLTFHPVISRSTNADARAGAGNVIYPALDEEGIYYILAKKVVVSGEDLVDAQPDFDQYGRPAVSFRFDAAGARKFGDYTAHNIGNPFAIVLDKEVISAPVIQAHIPGGAGIITGSFNVDESTKLAVLLRAGALPAKLAFVEERTIGPQLGQDSIDAGRIACLVALAAVLLFMALSYGWFGILANIALLMNIGMIFGILSLIGATLTLPGIAGIVLTIGMAVDANVLIFERIREELRTARGPARAIELGYEKALSAILDANITTVITAAILFVMGSGPVKGFAVTLFFGILTSVFTAYFVTRLMIVMWFEYRRPKKIEV